MRLNLKSTFLRNLSNIPGWRTDRKIIIFESDDWGSIRIPSNSSREKLIEKDVIQKANISHYNQFDSLESNEDLNNLFEILTGFKDNYGNHPVFTAINIIANPDFDRIKQSEFQNYYFEPFTDTLKKYPKHDKVLDLWKEGAAKNLFVPQFHGREHLNVNAWLKALKENRPKTRIAFDYGICGIDGVSLGESKIPYQAAFDIEQPNELDYLNNVIKDGTSLFQELVGYEATYFVPTNGPFNLNLEKTLHDNGIKYIMLDKLQKEPLGNGQYRTHFRYLGKHNKLSQVYMSRNAAFEPSAGGKNWINSCISDISIAFRWNKPATISTHRVNYIGFLDPANRSRSLKLLKELISIILKLWPDVEFMTSDKLGDLISTQNEKL